MTKTINLKTTNNPSVFEISLEDLKYLRENEIVKIIIDDGEDLKISFKEEDYVKEY